MSIAYEWGEDPGRSETSDEAERALLGALLLVGEVGLPACTRLRPEDFRSAQRAAVFTTIRKLSFLGTPVDVITVAHELEKGKVSPPRTMGWWTAVASLLDYKTVGATDDASMASYARIIAEASLLRRRAAWGAA